MHPLLNFLAAASLDFRRNSYLKVSICDFLISLSIQFDTTKYRLVILLNIEVLLSYDFGLFNNCRDSRALTGREPFSTRVLTLSNPHHVGEIVKIYSRKRIANLHNMDMFPNFDNGRYIGCNFRRGEIRNRRKCEGKIFAKETSQHLKQDELKGILVDAKAKGIETHKERDKKQFI